MTDAIETKTKTGFAAWWDGWAAKRVLPAATALLAIATGWVGLTSSWQKQEIDAQRHRLESQKSEIDQLNAQIDAAIRQSQNDRAQRESLERLQITLYEHVQKVLSHKEQTADDRVTKAAAVLVTHLAAGDFRTGLLEALKVGAASEPARREVQFQIDEAEKYERARLRDPVQKQAAAAAAEANAQQPGQPIRWANWDFDFFWCEATPANQKLAEAAREKLLEMDANASGRWRVRMLTRERNASVGYGVTGNVIRRDQGDQAEAKMVETLKTALRDATGRPFEVNDSSQGTRWYVSAFFCAG